MTIIAILQTALELKAILSGNVLYVTFRQSHHIFYSWYAWYGIMVCTKFIRKKASMKLQCPREMIN